MNQPLIKRIFHYFKLKFSKAGLNNEEVKDALCGIK